MEGMNEPRKGDKSMKKKNKLFRLLLALFASLSGITGYAEETGESVLQSDSEKEIYEENEPDNKEKIEETIDSSAPDPENYHMVIRDYELESADHLIELIKDYADENYDIKLIRTISIAYENDAGTQIEFPEETEVELQIDIAAVNNTDRICVFKYDESEVQEYSCVYEEGLITFSTDQAGVYVVAGFENNTVSSEEIVVEDDQSSEKLTISEFVSWQEKDHLFMDGNHGRLILEYAEPSYEQISYDLPEYVLIKVEELDELQKVQIIGWDSNYSDGQTGNFVFYPTLETKEYIVPEHLSPVLDVIVNRTYVPETVKAPLMLKNRMLLANSSVSVHDSILDGSYKQTNALTNVDKEDDYRKTIRLPVALMRIIIF